ncbi:hypothetical protein [Vibrio brasiliensis]
MDPAKYLKEIDWAYLAKEVPRVLDDLILRINKFLNSYLIPHKFIKDANRLRKALIALSDELLEGVKKALDELNKMVDNLLGYTDEVPVLAGGYPLTETTKVTEEIGNKVKKYEIDVKEAIEEPNLKKKKKKKEFVTSEEVDMSPGSPAHKDMRWKEYTGDWSYERWSKQYDVNMKNCSVGLAREKAYREVLGGKSKLTKTPYTNRQIDVFIDEDDYMGQLKTGKVYLTEQAKIDIKKDTWLVKEGYQVEYILEQGASKPFLEALNKGGIKYHVGSKIP